MQALPRKPTLWVCALLAAACDPTGTSNLARTTAPLTGGIDDLPATRASSSTVFIAAGVSEACSGVLITPTRVLTAAHCGRAWAGGGYTVDLVPTSSSLPVTRRVVSCVAHPEATLSGVTDCGSLPSADFEYDDSHDLAILELSSAVPGTYPRSIGAPRSCLREESVPTIVRSGTFERQAISGTVSGTHNLSIFPRPTQGGDSGGPHTEARWDQTDGSVIGITSKAIPTGNVLVWGPQNIAWIWSVLDPAGNCIAGAARGSCILPGTSTPLPDDDGDGLPNMRDLCPQRALVASCDGQHCDVDGDWVGDDCDDYDGLPTSEPTLCNHRDFDLDGVPDEVDICPRVPGAPEDGTDSDDDGVPDECDRCLGADDRGVDFDGEDTDGDGVVDACDTCAVPNPAGVDGMQPNCNLDAELLAGGPFLGDHCDPNPCPTEARVQTTVQSGGGTYFESDNLTIVGAGMATADADPDPRGTYRTGFRFCACAGAAEDTAAARRACADTSGCELSAFLYRTPEEGPWFPRDSLFSGETVEAGPSGIDQEIVTPYTDVPSMPESSAFSVFERDDSYRASWDFTSPSLPASAPQPSTTGSGGLVLEELRAVTWSIALGGADPDDAGESGFGCNDSDLSCPPAGDLLNSHYASTVNRRTSGLRAPVLVPEIDVIGAFLAPEPICPECRAAFPPPVLARRCFEDFACLAFGQPLVALPLEPFLELVPSHREQDLADLLERLEDSSLSWAPVSEPIETLPADALRLIAVSSGDSLASFALMNRRGVPVAQRLDHEALPALDDGQARIYSGVRGAALTLGAGSTTITMLSLTSGAERVVYLEDIDGNGNVLHTVTSAALDASARRLLVLDRDDSNRRLVLIDLGTGHMRVVYADPSDAGREGHFLTGLPGGSWALVSVAGDDLLAVVFDVTDEGVEVRRSGARTVDGFWGVVGGMRRGVYWLGAGAEADGIALSNMQPATMEDLDAAL